MKISFNWLKDYIELSEPPEQVAQILTQSGLEVASMTIFEPAKNRLKGLVIGRVMTCEKHPNADRLKVTLVDIGQDTPLHIVCGAPNVQADQKVVVAPVGTLLYNNEGVALKIEKAKIRGELSEGMICAESEIGLGHAHEGIIVLNTPLAPGTSAAQYFNTQPDTILEIDLTPNRADACSHLGTAKELSALLDRVVWYPSIEKFRVTIQDLPMQIEVLDHSACPRYSGITISGVKVQPSPPWLENRLRAIGISPINNVVDVTNFVLHELGQPIHAFDYDQIVGNKITVKTLAPETDFITIDDRKRRLSGSELMVCDQERGISMAGILGGKHTSIHRDTQNIFLESAYFTPSVIRKTAREHAIKTEASFRYERGTDPNITVYALKRACLLIQEIAQGTIASPLIDLYPQKIADLRVKVYYKNIARLLGFRIPESVINKILSGLDIGICHETEASFVASIPPYRVDVKREVDVIEEIIRIYGYDRIEVTGKLSSTYLARTVQPEQNKLRHGVAELLAANGYHEICTNSLTGSSYLGLINASDALQQQVTILNPLSETLDALRTTLFFTGLEALAYNINRKQADLKLFEFGKTYRKEGQRYVENNRLGIWLTGNIEAINWIRKPREVTFQDMHAIIHKVLHKLHISPALSTHPTQTALYQAGIQVALEQTPLLTAGKIQQSVLKHIGIKQAVFFADIDWDALLCKWRSLTQFQEISKFPPVRRDVSLVLNESVTFDAVSRVIAQQGSEYIKSVAVFDVYQDDQLGRGEKAYSLRFLLQGREKTLENKEIEQILTHLMRSFEDQLGAVIRK